MFRRILIPLDVTGFGDHALPYAISIAQRTGALLELVHVHRRIEADAGLMSMPQYHFEHVELTLHAEDDAAVLREDAALEARARDIEERFGVRAVARVVRGSRAQALRHQATDGAADLVVMATHARSGMPRMMKGDLAHELIRQLNIPTLCVRPVEEDAPLDTGRIGTILVTVDGSDFSEQILEVVAPFAAVMKARITLMHVVSPASLMITGMSDLQRTIPHRMEALEYLNHVASRLPAGLPQPALVAAEAGDAASAIIDELRRGEYGALAIATHGRSGLSRLILGSVAEQVLRATRTPVLLYRPRLQALHAGEVTREFSDTAE